MEKKSIFGVLGLFYTSCFAVSLLFGQVMKPEKVFILFYLVYPLNYVIFMCYVVVVVVTYCRN